MGLVLSVQGRYHYERRIQLSNTEKTPAWPSGQCNRRGELSEGSGFDPGKILLVLGVSKPPTEVVKVFVLLLRLRTLNITCLSVTVHYH